MNMNAIQGSITEPLSEVIVNAANPQLCGGHGVDGAIHEKAGHMLLGACLRWRLENGPLNTGKAMITDAFGIDCKTIIHTVGPIITGDENKYMIEMKDKQLSECYYNSMFLVMKHGFKSISFPCISTGYYNFPKQKAASIAINTVNDFLNKMSHKIEDVYFFCYDTENYLIYQELLKGV